MIFHRRPTHRIHHSYDTELPAVDFFRFLSCRRSPKTGGMNPRVNLLALALIASFISQVRADDDFLAKESLGQLKLNQGADAVVKALGKPESKGEDLFQGADGTWVQEWSYPAQGLQLVMASSEKGGAKMISSITATDGCKLATARGIRLGSTVAQVQKAYADVRSQEGASDEEFVAGSIYGGVIFSLEKGKVTRIFFGAAAE